MEFHGIPLFYAVPLMVFGPVLMLIMFKVIRIQSLFISTADEKELRAKQRRLEKKREEEQARSARFKKPRITAKMVIGQVVLYGAFIAFTGAFSNWPPYHYAPPESAQIKFSMSINGERKVACRTRDAEELSKLAANMRGAKSCPRERKDVTVHFSLDGKTVFSETAKPAGLRSDGPSGFYRTFIVPAGAHMLEVSVFHGDSEKPSETFARKIELSSGQAIALTHTVADGIVIH